MLRSFRNIIRFSFSELSGNLKPKGLYFDYQATTPVDYRVLDAMLPYMTQNFGNPHSKTQYLNCKIVNMDGKLKRRLKKQERTLPILLNVIQNKLFSLLEQLNPTIFLSKGLQIFMERL